MFSGVVSARLTSRMMSSGPLLSGLQRTSFLEINFASDAGVGGEFAAGEGSWDADDRAFGGLGGDVGVGGLGEGHEVGFGVDVIP